MKKITKITINKKTGEMKFIYNEKLLDVFTKNNTIGSRLDARASHVEPDEHKPGKWVVDLTPVGGPVIDGFDKRSVALDYEVDWLNDNILVGGTDVRN